MPNAKGEITHFPPHVMFYAGYIAKADLGVGAVLGPNGNPTGPAFVAGDGAPHALIIVPLVDRGDPNQNSGVTGSDHAAMSNHTH